MSATWTIQGHWEKSLPFADARWSLQWTDAFPWLHFILRAFWKTGENEKKKKSPQINWPARKWYLSSYFVNNLCVPCTKDLGWKPLGLTHDGGKVAARDDGWAKQFAVSFSSSLFPWLPLHPFNFRLKFFKPMELSCWWSEGLVVSHKWVTCQCLPSSSRG